LFVARRVQKLDRHAAAAMSYSWMRPPRRSRRSTRNGVGAEVDAARVEGFLSGGEAEGTMGPLFVVVPDVDAEDVFELAAAEDQQAVETFVADGADPAFMWAFPFGARTGVRMTLIPSLSRKASNGRGNFASRSWIRNRTCRSWSSSSISRLRACCSIHAVFGLLVIAKYSTGRLPIEMKPST